MPDNDLYQRIYNAVALIPVGKVSTYGAIAKHVGIASSRLVGYALNALAFSESDLPCHRVVNRNGELTGKLHFDTPTLMRELLEGEGVKFENDRVVMKGYFWDEFDL